MAVLLSEITKRARRMRRSENPTVPIFQGLMRNGDYGYDAACILDSIHRLGVQGPEQPTLQEACRLVRKTLTVVDPGSMSVSQRKMEALSGGRLPNDATPGVFDPQESSG